MELSGLLLPVYEPDDFLLESVTPATFAERRSMRAVAGWPGAVASASIDCAGVQRAPIAPAVRLSSVDVGLGDFAGASVAAKRSPPKGVTALSIRVSVVPLGASVRSSCAPVSGRAGRASRSFALPSVAAALMGGSGVSLSSDASAAAAAAGGATIRACKGSGVTSSGSACRGEGGFRGSALPGSVSRRHPFGCLEELRN